MNIIITWSLRQYLEKVIVEASKDTIEGKHYIDET